MDLHGIFWGMKLSITVIRVFVHYENRLYLRYGRTGTGLAKRMSRFRTLIRIHEPSFRSANFVPMILLSKNRMSSGRLYTRMGRIIETFFRAA